MTVPVSGGADVLRDALARLQGSSITIVEVGLRRPDLDDVFMTLTGMPLGRPRPLKPKRNQLSRVAADQGQRLETVR